MIDKEKILDKLERWAASGELLEAARQAFNLHNTPALLLQWIAELSRGDHHLLPPVELLDGQTMAGLRGAYTASDPNGQERIYLNAAWLQRADPKAIEAVLLEEIGHAIDYQINKGKDSQGDEGSAFAASLHNRSIPESIYQEQDHQFLVINGQQIAIEAATITSPIATSSFSDGIGGFDELDSPRTITTTTINGRNYALIHAYSDNGVQIVDITDLSTPTPVAVLQDGVTYTELEGARHSAITNSNGRTYALIAGYLDDGIQIADITDPANPTSAGRIRDGDNGGEGNYKLDGAYFIATTSTGGKTFALVTSYNDDSLQIINITDPTNPSLAKSITDGAGGYEKLNGARGLTTVEIAGSKYALIASSSDDGVQIVNITDPENPSAVSSITDGVGGFNELEAARMVSAASIGGKPMPLSQRKMTTAFKSSISAILQPQPQPLILTKVISIVRGAHLTFSPKFGTSARFQSIINTTH